MNEATDDWQAPGPGRWERDEAHQSAPFCGHMLEFISRHLNDGMLEGGERYGLLIDMEAAVVDRWLFARVKPVGAPDKPGELPPRWLFKLIVALHPAIRRRHKAAKKALAENRWRKDADEWQDHGRKAMRERLLGLQAVDLGSLTDAELQRHIEAVRALTAEGFRIHFRNAVAHWLGVGDWLVHCQRWTGENPALALQALKGASPFSIDTVSYLDRIAAAARDVPAAMKAIHGRGDPQDRLAVLAQSSPAVGEALSAYLSEHGRQVFTGFDLLDRTLIELPETILDSIGSRLDHRAAGLSDDPYPASLRARVPSEHMAEYDELFATARALYRLRDSDVGPCFHWPLGLMRLALLEAGGRLVDLGRIRDTEDVFEATHDELSALLGGRDNAPPLTELARRTAERISRISDVPPSTLGPEDGPPPPDGWLPPAMERLTAALMTAMSVEMGGAEDGAAEAAQAAGTSLSGFGASKGRATGRACIVSGPDDFARLKQGDILVAPFTTPAYNVVLPLLAGVVTDKGGILSHAAIVAREFSIPAVVGCGDATQVIADSALIRIDGATGLVEVVEAATPAELRA
jgi:pyruvate,water dikinase